MNIFVLDWDLNIFTLTVYLIILLFVELYNIWSTSLVSYGSIMFFLMKTSLIYIKRNNNTESPVLQRFSENEQEL